jgi:hypothetical protein
MHHHGVTWLDLHGSKRFDQLRNLEAAIMSGRVEHRDRLLLNPQAMVVGVIKAVLVPGHHETLVVDDD